MIGSIMATVVAVLTAGLLGVGCLIGALSMDKAEVHLDSNLAFVMCIVVAVIGFLIMIVMIIGAWIDFAPLQLIGIVFMGLFGAVSVFGFVVAVVKHDIALNIIGMVWTQEIFYKGVRGVNVVIEEKYNCTGWDVVATPAPAAVSYLLEDAPDKSKFPLCYSVFEAELAGDLCFGIGVGFIVIAVFSILSVVFRAMEMCPDEGVYNSPMDGIDEEGVETEMVKENNRTERKTNRSGRQTKRKKEEEEEDEDEESEDEYESESADEDEYESEEDYESEEEEDYEYSESDYDYDYEDEDTPPPKKRR